MPQSHEFEPGNYLIRQGEIDNHAYVIESGSVKIVVKEGDHEQVMGIAGAGEVVGEMAFIDKSARSASVVALEPTRAQSMTRQELGKAMETDPGACMPFLRAALDRLRANNAMLVAAQQTKELIKTTRVQLTLEPVSDAARQVCPRPAVIELDVVSGKIEALIRLDGLDKHFKITSKAFLPDMQR